MLTCLSLICYQYNLSIELFISTVDVQHCLFTKLELAALYSLDDIRYSVGISVSDLVEVRSVLDLSNALGALEDLHALNVQFFCNDILEAFNNCIALAVAQCNTQFAQRLTVLDIVLASDRSCQIDDASYKLYFIKQLVITEVLGDISPVFKVNGVAACKWKSLHILTST